MLIINQDRTELINLDNVSFIAQMEVPEDDTIEYVCYTIDDCKFHLGKYSDTPEHENQLERIAQCIGAASVYRMPEE